jgi:hypothetical protein
MFDYQQMQTIIALLLTTTTMGNQHFYSFFIAHLIMQKESFQASNPISTASRSNQRAHKKHNPIQCFARSNAFNSKKLLDETLSK